MESLGAEVEAYKLASYGRLYGNEGGKLYVSQMVDSLVAYDGDEIGSSNGISYGNGDRKIGGCTLVE